MRDWVLIENQTFSTPIAETRRSGRVWQTFQTEGSHLFPSEWNRFFPPRSRRWVLQNLESGEKKMVDRLEFSPKSYLCAILGDHYAPAGPASGFELVLFTKSHKINGRGSLWWRKANAFLIDSLSCRKNVLLFFLFRGRDFFSSGFAFSWISTFNKFGNCLKLNIFTLKWFLIA